jgi:acyl carrier protein
MKQEDFFKVVGYVLDIPIVEIKLTSSFSELGADQYDKMEIAVMTEERHGNWNVVPYDDLEKMTTIEDAFKYFSSRFGKTKQNKRRDKWIKKNFSELSQTN